MLVIGNDSMIVASEVVWFVGALLLVLHASHVIVAAFGVAFRRDIGCCSNDIDVFGGKCSG